MVYEFNESDLKYALKTIDELINIHLKDKEYISPNNIPWEAIRVMIIQSVYGSKIDNEYDMKILESLVNLYFNEKTYDLNYPLFKTSSENQANILMIPEKSNNEEYLEWINSLPEIESPEWSSLPKYAENLIKESPSNRFINHLYSYIIPLWIFFNYELFAIYIKKG